MGIAPVETPVNTVTQVKYVSSKSEAEILALTPNDAKWYDKGFYYPNDIPLKPYYYRVVNGEMVLYAGGETGIVAAGCTINDKVIGGVKSHILTDDVLVVPEGYDYNTFPMKVDGDIILDGEINII